MKNKLNHPLFSLLLAVLFALVFYTFNTPLGPSIGSDNAIYLTMGTALANGYAPYTDVFDHKGPVLFLLQALPQALGGGYSTMAVFIQQVIFLFACLRVIHALAFKFHLPCSLLPQVAYLALICTHVGGGNLTEEYTNLFTLLAFLLIVCHFPPDCDKAPTRSLLYPATQIGALFMLCVLTRANNALPLAGAVLALTLCLLFSKDFRRLSSCILGFLAGSAVVLLPIVLWLVHHGALYEAFYASFLHNLMYAGTQGASRMDTLFHSSYGHWAILMAAISCLAALILFLRTRRMALPAVLVSSAAMGGAAAFISHKFYGHYLILAAPAAVMGVCILLHAIPSLLHGRSRAILGAVLCICVAWLGTQGANAMRSRIAECASLPEFTENAQALFAHVPEDERDQFMGYRLEPKWYVAAKALPCMRFYFLQEVLADADPAVMDEIVAEFHTQPPKWLVIYYDRPFYPPYDARVAEIFETQYEFVDAKGDYQLMRLIASEPS